MASIEPYPIQDTTATHAIIEIFGGDNNLSRFVSEDIQEIMAGNSGDIAVLALADLADFPAQVLELSPRTGIRVVENLGEIDTGEPEALANFLSRALATYGAGVRKAIGFWDHGSGVFDEYDPAETLLTRRLTSVPRRHRSRSHPARRLFFSRARVATDSRIRAMLHDDTNGGVLTNLEASKVLEVAFKRAGQEEKVDLIFSDTCLNGMIEVTEQLSNFAACIVGSEDLEPGDGWEYHEWLTRMSANPPASGDDWGLLAVEAFGAGYQNRLDQYPCTLGAFRTENEIATRFKDLLEATQQSGEAGFWLLERARGKSQAFARRDTYDIKDFAENVISIADTDPVKNAAQGLRDAFDQARVHSVALGTSVSRSHGLAFWFPSNRWTFDEDIQTYARLDFSTKTGWNEYLSEYR